MFERAFSLITSKFNSNEVLPHFINERCFGEDFALWLALALRNVGYSVSDPVQEDWGWCLILTSEGCKFTLTIGIEDDSVGESRAEWRVGISYERMLNGLGSLFKRFPTAQLDQLAGNLAAILMAEPSFEKFLRI